MNEMYFNNDTFGGVYTLYVTMIQVVGKQGKRSAILVMFTCIIAELSS